MSQGLKENFFCFQFCNISPEQHHSLFSNKIGECKVDSNKPEQTANTAKAIIIVSFSLFPFSLLIQIEENS